MIAIGFDALQVARRRLAFLFALLLGSLVFGHSPATASALDPTPRQSADSPRILLALQDSEGQKKKKKASSFLADLLEKELREHVDDEDEAVLDALRSRQRNERSPSPNPDLARRQSVAPTQSSAALGAQPVSVAAAPANGRNVTQLTFGQQGRRIGQFRQTAPGQWQEIGDDGGGFSFQESTRDDWSVYLSDPSRGVRIQLDLYRKLVLYEDSNAPGMRPLYEIINSAAAPAAYTSMPAARPSQPMQEVPASPIPRPALDATGRTVTQATYGQQGRPLGQYRQTGPRAWQETSGSSDGFSFVENDRDDWSVYLFDASRGVRIQLDLYRKLVLYADGNASELSPLYEIITAAAAPVAYAREPSPLPTQPTPPIVEQPAVAPSAINANGRTVTQVTIGQQGRSIGQYLQTGSGRWREIGDSGGGFDFDEINRDDWSVYLHDPSRGVRVQIDLYRKLVLYSGSTSGEMTPLYDVLSASTPRVASTSPVTRPVGPEPTQPIDLGGGNASRTQKEFCWKDSYGRGVGAVPNSCGPGREGIGLLCYSKCPANSQRFGVDCHTVCPSGMEDQGLFCRAKEYGRGAGFPIEFGEFNGDGMRRRCEAKHGRGNCEINGLIYYPKCKAGYSNFGCCMCRPKVPDCGALGMNPGMDLSCAKVVTIGDPETGTCAAGEEKDGGLCYPQCKAGYTGVGPVCWASPPSSWVECGMGAAKDSRTCAEIVFGQVTSVGQMAFNIATLGSGTAASGAASAASKAGRLADLKRKYEQLKAMYKSAKPAIEVALAAKQAHGAAVNAVELIDSDVVTEEDIIRISAEIVAIADPSGVADTVAAYTYPVCSKYGF